MVPIVVSQRRIRSNAQVAGVHRLAGPSAAGRLAIFIICGLFVVTVRDADSLLVPRTRSSHILAASSFANFGFIRGTRIIKLLVSL
jgi:hypothetical protein